MSEHYDFHYQPTGSGAISGQQVLQQTEDAINELGDYVNDNVGGAMDVAQEALETAQNAEQDAQTALDTANSFSSAIQSAQQDASTALSTAQTAQTTATNANATAIQASQDASSAVTTANNASGQVSTLSGTVTALGQRVTTAEGNIGQNTSDITALTTRVGTAEGNITTLQNDVSIAQGNASSAMTTAGTVKQQSYVLRYSSTTLVASSTNSNTLLDNTDNLKVGDKVIDSSGVIYSVTAIDTANSTFTIGTALIDLAQDSDVVHKSGDETISGIKTWASAQIWPTNCQRRMTDAIEKGQVPSSSLARNDYYTLKNGNTTYAGALGIFGCILDNNNAVSTYFHAIKNVADTTTRTTFSVKYYTNTDEKTVETNGDIIPTTSSQNLGDSTNKWSTINGINPGSLSLPDLSNGIDISSYIDVSQTSTYTAPADGYISICGHASSTNTILIKDHDYDFGIGARAAIIAPSTFTTYVIIPVVKNHVYDIICNAVTTLDYAKFYPCLGNV